MPATSLAGKFCAHPWVYAEIYNGGGVYICCPAWNGNKHVGNIYQGSFDDIWNSMQAQLFRAGILNGSFDQCDHRKCPAIISGNLPTREEARVGGFSDVVSEAMDLNLVRAERGPPVVKIGYDASCNLFCPSCRTELMMAKTHEQARLDRIRDEFVIPFLKDADVLVMSSDGDPFASKHYREVMKLTKQKLPKLRLGICTNAVLFDERAWNDCELEGRVHLVQVSIDAAKSETYSHVRRGGDFNRLLRNLEFISTKRHSQDRFNRYDLLFVVQACNFTEMADFVRLGKSLGVDSVEFSPIDHWDRGMNATEYRDSKVWDPRHPQYLEFMEALRDPILDDPKVVFTARRMLLEQDQPAELAINFKTGEIRRAV